MKIEQREWNSLGKGWDKRNRLAHSRKRQEASGKGLSEPQRGKKPTGPGYTNLIDKRPGSWNSSVGFVPLPLPRAEQLGDSQCPNQGLNPHPWR